MVRRSLERVVGRHRSADSNRDGCQRVRGRRPDRCRNRRPDRAGRTNFSNPRRESLDWSFASLGEPTPNSSATPKHQLIRRRSRSRIGFSQPSVSHRAKPTRSTTRRSHPAPMCHTTGDDPAPASIILRMLRGVLIMPSSELRTPRRDPAVTLQSARRARLLTVTRFCESSGDGKSAG